MEGRSKAWRFLTGNLDDVRNVAEKIRDGFLERMRVSLPHFSHRSNRPRRQFGGKTLKAKQQFTAMQLGDLVATVLPQAGTRNADSSKLKAAVISPRLRSAFAQSGAETPMPPRL